MDHAKTYDDNLADITQVKEPVCEYATLSKSDEQVQSPPRDILIDAAEYALKMKSRGGLIPNREVASIINSRFGWR